MPTAEASERGGKVRPRIERVPGTLDTDTILFGKRGPSIFVYQLIQHPAVDIVDVEDRADLACHALKRPSPVFVGCFCPVSFNVSTRSRGGKSGSNTTMPVEDRPAGVESENLDLRCHFRRRVVCRVPRDRTGKSSSSSAGRATPSN